MGLFSLKRKAKVPIQPGSEALSVLAVSNGPEALTPLYRALTDLSYKTLMVHDVGEFIESLDHVKPDVILVSVNLQNTDVMKVITLLEIHGFPCIAFGENDDEETETRLLSTDVGHFLPSPLTLEAFLEKAELLAITHDLQSDSQKPDEKGWGKIIRILKKEVLRNHVVKSDHDLSMNLDDLTPVEDIDLSIGKNVGADIFISMPLNHKCILYLRKGSLVLKENWERLSKLERSRVLKKRIA